MYAHITKENKKSKISPQAIRCFFFGYDYHTNIYMCFSPIGGKKVDYINTQFNKNNLVSKLIKYKIPFNTSTILFTSGDVIIEIKKYI